MRVSKRGIDFIISREGYRSVAYQNAGDRYTLGYGLTYIPRLKRYVRAGDTTDRTQAYSDMQDYIYTQVEPRLNTALKGLQVTQSGYDALTSYCFNRGVGNFLKTDLYRMILKNPKDSRIRQQFEIDWGTNQTYRDSLIERRKLEANLYFTDTATSTVSDNGNYNTTNIITAVVLIIALLIIFNHKRFLQLWSFFKEKCL
jgi:lysozyme